MTPGRTGATGVAAARSVVSMAAAEGLSFGGALLRENARVSCACRLRRNCAVAVATQRIF